MIVQYDSYDRPDYLKCKKSRSLNQNQNKPSGKRNYQQLRQGISYEAPNDFFLNRTFLNKQTYFNPYINNQFKDSQKRLPPKISAGLSNQNQYSVSQSHNDQATSTEKDKDKGSKQIDKDQNYKQSVVKIYDPILNQHKEMNLSNEGLKNKNNFKEIYEKKEQQEGFRKTLGLFGDFVKRNDQMNVFGHLLNNKRGVHVQPRNKVYAFEDSLGQKIPRYTYNSSFVNEQAIDEFMRTNVNDWSLFRNSQTAYSKDYKLKQQQIRQQRNKTIEQVKQIKDQILNNSIKVDDQDHKYCKEKEVSLKNIIGRLKGRRNSGYYEQKEHQLYRPSEEYINDFEKNNYHQIAEYQMKQQRKMGEYKNAEFHKHLLSAKRTSYMQN